MGRPSRNYPTPDTVYHVICRGNNRQEIFLDNRDYFRYLDLWHKYKAEMDFEVYAYVLMPNHVHWLLKTGLTPLWEIMHRMHSTYAKWFNHRHERVGHLFQDRYKSIICDTDSYLLVLARYIHLNPIRAGLVREVNHYPWSSFPGYCGHENTILNTSFLLNFFSSETAKARHKLINFTREGIDRQQDSTEANPDIDQKLQKEKWHLMPFNSNIVQTRVERQNKTTPLTINHITDWVIKETGVTLTELIGNMQQRHVTEARSLLIRIAVGEAGIKRSDVAVFLDKNRSLITRVMEKWANQGVPPRAEQRLLKFVNNLQQNQLATPGTSGEGSIVYF